MIKRIIIAIFALATSLTGVAQQRVVAFYNVENLFDTINCPTATDEDMLPLADRRWNTERYQAKIKSISEIIANLSAHDYPAIVGLAEVENSVVVEELATTSALSAASYKICHYNSPDRRGIDVALLYRDDIFHIEASQAIAATNDYPTRDILTAWGTIDNEKVFIAVVHWPSRIGGVKFTEPQRILCAEQMRHIVDSVQHRDPTTKIIIMGDMNDNPRNKSISTSLGAKRRIKQLSTNDLYTPFAHARPGSSVYDNRWNHYDNIIVSANLLHSEGLHLQPTEGKAMGGVFCQPDMLDQHSHPKPTYQGTDYIGGPSDHLPIYVILGNK
ncbi:MAG: endonuclease/exonuclease/phosphatase family protein [Alistipes sp.]|nr:endonuclease/exonuclease/phosphatase family protein [Alistipes sp.]